MSAEALGALLLDLYRLARESPLADFQRRVLERLQDTVPFDGAWWGMARMDRQLHSSFPFHMPAHFVSYWSGMREHDVFAEFVMARPGTTLNFHAATAASNPTFDRFLLEFGIRQTLCTLLVNPTLNLITFLSLYRKADEPAFTEEQRQLKQLVMPHLWAAWTSNWIAQLANSRAHSVSSSAAMAVADQRGVLHAAEPRFAELMHVEWPDWSGPELPAAAAGTALGPDGIAMGVRTVLQMIPVHGLYLVELRERSPLDHLTARERDIARQFGRGESYKEIAALLRVAPATVRAHLRAIYSKLHVSDKGELANLLSHHSEPRSLSLDK